MGQAVPPSPIRLTAPGLVLRANLDSDVEAATAMFADPATRQWYSGPVDLSRERVLSWCRSSADWSDGGHATWAIADADDNAESMLGNLSLIRIDTAELTAGIAYRIAPAARGRGLATSAVQTATAWAFGVLGLERIELVHAVDNPASCRVADKAGYPCEGMQRAGYRDDEGHRWDAHLHARLATDPAPQPVR